MESCACKFKRNVCVLNAISKMNNIDKDKLLHFFWNAILLIPLVALFGNLWGCVLLAFIGAIKEIVHDLIMNKGNCEIMDFVWGVLPIPMHFIYNLI